jgi:thiosulfate/3-mercaptopyruvate sulfurtransferase
MLNPTPVTVSPAGLADQLWRQDGPSLVVVDCRFSLADPNLGRQQYLAGHIPGAHYLDLNQDLSSPVGNHGGRHPLPDLLIFTAKLAALGITPETLVIAYDDSRFAFAARFWWLMRWLGHERVAVLEGGLVAFQAAGYPLSTFLPEPTPATLGAGTWQPQLDWLVDIEQVKNRQDGAVLIDSREPERYRGEREPIDPIAGHIPGAVNYPWQQITDTTGKLQSTEQLQAQWADLQAAPEVMVYCGSGVTACVNLLGLAAAGYPLGPGGAKLYPGSWSDWCSYLV